MVAKTGSVERTITYEHQGRKLTSESAFQGVAVVEVAWIDNAEKDRKKAAKQLVTLEDGSHIVVNANDCFVVVEARSIDKPGAWPTFVRWTEHAFLWACMGAVIGLLFVGVVFAVYLLLLAVFFLWAFVTWEALSDHQWEIVGFVFSDHFFDALLTALRTVALFVVGFGIIGPFSDNMGSTFNKRKQQ